MKGKEEQYKVELIEDLPEDAEISFTVRRIHGSLCRAASDEYKRRR